MDAVNSMSHDRFHHLSQTHHSPTHTMTFAWLYSCCPSWPHSSSTIASSFPILSYHSTLSCSNLSNLQYIITFSPLLALPMALFVLSPAWLVRQLYPQLFKLFGCEYQLRSSSLLARITSPQWIGVYEYLLFDLFYFLSFFLYSLFLSFLSFYFEFSFYFAFELYYNSYL